MKNEELRIEKGQHYEQLHGIQATVFHIAAASGDRSSRSLSRARQIRHDQERHNKPAQNIQTRTFDFACRIVRLHQYLYHCGGTQRDIARQVLRSGTSIGANLEEADAGQSRADFISKCGIALKEARETHFWLRVMSETGLVPAQRLAPLVCEASEIVAILTAIVKKSRNNEN